MRKMPYCEAAVTCCCPLIDAVTLLLLLLLQVLMHPMPRAARWNAQLSPYLLQVNDQLLLQPQAVLLSVVRALHVIRAVLQEVRCARAAAAAAAA
jgi:hypothetical protein